MAKSIFQLSKQLISLSVFDKKVMLSYKNHKNFCCLDHAVLKIFVFF